MYFAIVNSAEQALIAGLAHVQAALRIAEEIDHPRRERLVIARREGEAGLSLDDHLDGSASPRSDDGLALRHPSSTTIPNGSGATDA